jgi:hypothetical protein
MVLAADPDIIFNILFMFLILYIMDFFYRCYVNFDIMRRIMEQYFNLNVVQVMNITGNIFEFTEC